MVDGFGPEERGMGRRHVMRVLGVWKDLEHMSDMVWICFMFHEAPVPCIWSPGTAAEVNKLSTVL